jgi:hypothetical protein
MIRLSEVDDDRIRCSRTCLLVFQRRGNCNYKLNLRFLGQLFLARKKGRNSLKMTFLGVNYELKRSFSGDF